MPKSATKSTKRTGTSRSRRTLPVEQTPESIAQQDRELDELLKNIGKQFEVKLEHVLQQLAREFGVYPHVIDLAITAQLFTMGVRTARRSIAVDEIYRHNKD